MAKEDLKTESTPAAASAPITIDQLLMVVREMVAANTMTPEAVRQIATQATVDAYDRTSGKLWDETKYPKKSVFNPAGDKDAPRGTILGEVFWLGYKLSESELTPREIALNNQLEPGAYGPDGDWMVREMQSGVRDRSKRKLLIVFPCLDDAARSRLPQGDPFAGKTGVEQMCEVMLGTLVMPAMA